MWGSVAHLSNRGCKHRPIRSQVLVLNTRSYKHCQSFCCILRIQRLPPSCYLAPKSNLQKFGEYILYGDYVGMLELFIQHKIYMWSAAPGTAPSICWTCWIFCVGEGGGHLHQSPAMATARLVQNCLDLGVATDAAPVIASTNEYQSLMEPDEFGEWNRWLIWTIILTLHWHWVPTNRVYRCM